MTDAAFWRAWNDLERPAAPDPRLCGLCGSRLDRRGRCSAAPDRPERCTLCGLPAPECNGYCRRCNDDDEFYD